MKNPTDALERYFQEILNIHIQIHPWKGRNKLPFFLLDLYEFYEVSLFKQTCLLIFTKKNTESTPSSIEKYLKQVQKIKDLICIYVTPTISPYNRKRLIELQIPFVVPGNQMYIPQLGLDLREHFRKQQSHTDKPFSPATQAVIIYTLLQETFERLIPSELAQKLGYTLMTMTRAFNELEEANIGEIKRKGRERWWLFSEDRKQLWEQTKPLMQTPVKRCVWLKHKKSKIEAGLSALAHFSMISPPTHPVYATSIDQWKEWKQQGIEELFSPEEASFELEIWQYNPKLFAENNIVDPFSLYLSLEISKDERVEIALEKMMENIKW